MNTASNSGKKKAYRDEGHASRVASNAITDTRKKTVSSRLSVADSDIYRALFNSMSEGFCILEIVLKNGKPVDFLYKEVNPAFEKKVGLNGLAGKYLSRIFPEEARYWIDKYGEAAISGSAGFSDYSETLGKWFEISAFRTGTKDENLVAVLLDDITEKKRDQTKIREYELKYNSLVETANEGVCETDNDLVIKYVNKKLLEISGYSYEEVVGKPIIQFIHPEESYRIKKILARLSQEVRNNLEIKLCRKDKTDLFVSVNTSAIVDASGKPAGFMGMITDITEKTGIEKDLRRTRKKLVNAQKIGKIGTWDLNIRTGEIVLDKRAEEIFNVRRRTIVGTMPDLENFIHEEDLSHFREDFERALTGGQFESICRTRPINGKSNYILSKGIVARDKNCIPVSMSGISFDITEMKEDTEKTLIRLNEDLLRSNSDLQQFAYVASHDLQEPLRMVSSFTQLLQMKYAGKLDEDANEYINYAVNGSKRMYELINGLLTYSRIQTRGKEFNPVNLNSVVEKVKANMKLLTDEADAIINCSELPVVRCDENQMIQLFQNLIENGLKFRNGKPVITISSTLRNEMHIISVKDNGIGIESQYFEKIFRIFQRLHHSEYKGTGIGLAICQRIVERHGGRIWLNSKPGEGSTFSFSIPAG